MSWAAAHTSLLSKHMLHTQGYVWGSDDKNDVDGGSDVHDADDDGDGNVDGDDDDHDDDDDDDVSHDDNNEEDKD